MSNLKTATEEELREMDVPQIKDLDELKEYIKALTDREHTYGTCVYAVSMSAVAAFNHVAGALGLTGFQASHADLDILKRTRHLKHGFRIVDFRNLLYPQYWDDKTTPIFEEVLYNDEDEYFKKEAKKLLDESNGASPRVLAHWKRLAS